MDVFKRPVIERARECKGCNVHFRQELGNCHNCPYALAEAYKLYYWEQWLEKINSKTEASATKKSISSENNACTSGKNASHEKESIIIFL